MATPTAKGARLSNSHRNNPMKVKTRCRSTIRSPHHLYSAPGRYHRVSLDIRTVQFDLLKGRRQQYTSIKANSSSSNGSRLACIVVSPYALESAILHSVKRGLFMDSSWRNKNSLRCPVTILSAINEFHRMVPGRSPKQSYASYTDSLSSGCHGFSARGRRSLLVPA